jgi:hypothetical protein
MASPLTMYVQIKQDAVSQSLAEQGVANFTQGVQAGLDSTAIVHYATLALVPNLSTTPGQPAKGYAGLLLMTDFDLAMNPYLEVFWNAGGGIKQAIQGIAMIAYNPVPPIETLVQFQNFINSVNLTPAPASGNWTNFYQAYNLSVKQINES